MAGLWLEAFARFLQAHKADTWLRFFLRGDLKGVSSLRVSEGD